MAVRDEGYRAPVLWLLLPFSAGLLIRAETFRDAPLAWLAGALALGVAALLAGATLRGRTAFYAWSTCVTAAGVILGAARIAPVLDQPERWKALPPREASMEVSIVRVFPPSAAKPAASALGEIRATSSLIEDLRGMRVHLAQVPLPHGRLPLKTEVLRVRGVVESIHLDPRAIGRSPRENPGAESFRQYLLANAVYFRISRCSVEAELMPASPWSQRIARLGERFSEILSAGMPQRNDAAGAYLAMFLGRKEAMSDEQRLDYLQTGAMHLFAISGLHIAVIAACLHGLLRLTRLPALGCFALGVVALILFVEATGGTPSARRALLMVGLVWLGSSLRRPSNPVASIAAAAIGVLVLDPLALWSISFQFSYAVVAMLLLYAAPLTNRWLDRWHPWVHIPDSEWRWWHRWIFFGGRRVIILGCTSWSAALISTPLTIAYFGIATPGAILANLVLVPVSLFSITAGFASLLCGLVGIESLSVVFNHAAAMILWAMNSFAHIAADWPGMYFEGRFAASWIAPLLVGATLGVCLVGYGIRWRRLPGGFLVPPVLIVVALVFLVTPTEAAKQSGAMKSAYELAMERLQRSQPNEEKPLTPAQKERLAEINRIYQGKIAEREIFLQQRLAEVQGRGELEEAEKIRKQMASERARLEEEREDEKNQVRRSA